MLVELFKWFAQLKGFELILWCIALLFSLLFLIQTIVSFFIGGGDGDIDSFGDDGHGDAAFVWPVIQDYAFMDLTPMSIEVNLTKALSKQNIRVDVPSKFTVGISTEPGVMENAAERL